MTKFLLTDFPIPDVLSFTSSQLSPQGDGVSIHPTQEMAGRHTLVKRVCLASTHQLLTCNDRDRQSKESLGGDLQCNFKGRQTGGDRLT